jgi:hypothetical protein
MWLTGGRSDLRPLYNLENSYKSPDVWYSEDGANWIPVSELRGDYFAQNYDALQPRSVAPWYPHSGGREYIPGHQNGLLYDNNDNNNSILGRKRRLVFSADKQSALFVRGSNYYYYTKVRRLDNIIIRKM